MPDHSNRPTPVSEDGYTLIELLVAMVAALVVTGALMSFLIFTIRQENTVSSQTVTDRQAELGLAQFERDLREAENNPVPVSATWPLGNRTPVVITYVAGTSFTASFYLAPAGGCDGTTGAGASPCLQVTWSCTGISGGVLGSCTRTCTPPTAALASGTCSFTTPDHAREIAGVSTVTIGPTDASGNPIASAVGGSPPGTPPTFPSYVSVSFSLGTISQSDRGATHTIPGSGNVLVQGAVNLRNWS